MDGVGTSIAGRPRRLSADRRARPTYTFIWEEPLTVAAGLRLIALGTVPVMGAVRVVSIVGFSRVD